MGDEPIKKSEILKKEKKDEENIEPCTSAPSAEHARAHDDNEPCDDGRSG